MIDVSSSYSIIIFFFRQELSSCWDGRPFGHSRRGPKVEGGLLCPFPRGLDPI